jgi:predicted nucleic acid-binding protein
MRNVVQLLDEVRSLSKQERAELMRALSAAEAPGELPLIGAPEPHSVAWLRAERGHALLDPALPDADEIPAGAAAIAGIWSGKGAESGSAAARLPGRPALVATDLCFDLARGEAAASAFFQGGAAEIRLSTATYLELLAAAAAPDRIRIQRFAAAYPVLTLGPVASSRSVELLLEHRDRGLQPLQALVAATALAHEIPVVTRNPTPFAEIAGLVVFQPYGTRNP